MSHVPLRLIKQRRIQAAYRRRHAGSCADCGGLCHYSARRCMSCAKAARKRVYKCKDCGARIQRTSTRCRSCNLRFNGGVRMNAHKRRIARMMQHTSTCQSCGKPCTTGSKHCRPCESVRRTKRLCIECHRSKAIYVTGLCRPCQRQWQQDIVIQYREPGELPWGVKS